MIRRVASTLFFIFGGWMLTGEAIAAFFDAAPGITDNLAMLTIMVFVAGLPLLVGAWISPAARWRELGLTILIATGIAVCTGLSVFLVLSDPAAQKILPPMPDIDLAPFFGAANALLLSCAGWLLYRTGSRNSPEA